MKFADEPSRNLVIRLVHMLEHLPKFLEQYIACNKWKGRLYICDKAISYFDIVNKEEFDKLPPFAMDLENLSFRYIKDQDESDTILDLFSAMSTLNNIFEELRAKCLQELNLPGGISHGWLDFLLMEYYRNIQYNFKNRPTHITFLAEPYERFKNKLLTLPNDTGQTKTTE